MVTRQGRQVRRGEEGNQLNEEQARKLMLVRAIEIEDRAQQLLTREDRQQADAAALGGAPTLESKRGRHDMRGNDAFLARRADFAATRLATRNPRVEQAMRHARWPVWIGWAVPLAALVIGFLSNEIDSSKRMNIIAFPLIGMFVWNFAVYLALAINAAMGLARRGGEARGGWLTRLIHSASRRAAGRFGQQDAMGRGLAHFLGDWTNASAKLTGLRTARTFHLGAALFAAGLIGGLYLRALGLEYRAGWESTFLGPATVHAIVSTLLGPASALTGVPLPDASRLTALHWGAGNGENAGPWIHLYAATALLFVIGPRLLLAGWDGLRAWRLAGYFPVPGREDFYIRRLLRSAQGGAGQVRITPYAYRPADATIERLTALLRATFGDATRVDVDAPVDYGAEEAWLASAALRPETDHHLLLFNLSSTPEAENHGGLADGIAAAIRQRKSGTHLAALLDEASYRQRLGDARLPARRQAWEQMLGPLGLAVLAADFDHEDDAALVPRLEALLSADAAMTERR